MIKQETKFKETKIGPIPEDWEIDRLGIRADIVMGQSPESRYYNQKGDGHLFMQGVRTFGNKYPTFDTWTTKATKIAPAGSLLISVRAPVGDLNFTPVEMCIGRGLSSINAKNGNNEFIYQLLGAYRGKVLDQETGTVYGSISKVDLSNLELPFPPDEEQEKIAEVLGVLDEKIELNQKMNKTLEEIGQAMFKKYFGEYLNGENLPDGWKQSKIGDELEVFLGGTPSRTKKEYWENGNIPWINSGKVNDFRIINPSEYITEIGLEKSATKLLPKGTTVLAITGATLGQFSLLEIDTCFNQSVVGIKEGNILKKEFIYRWIETNINQIINSQTGGAQQHINKQIIEEFPIIVPKNGILENYYQEVSPLFELIKNNLFEIENLSEIRDSLLPKLMSGKLRVR